MTDLLSDISEAATYVAMGLYTVAFFLFVFDLAKRSSEGAEPTVVRSAVERRAEAAAATQRGGSQAAGAAGTTTLVRPATASSAVAGVDGVAAAANPAGTDVIEKVPAKGAKTSGLMRAAMIVTTVGWVIHLIADVARGVAADRVPWADMWEFSLTGTLVIVGIFLLANLRWDIRWIGTFIMGLVCVLLMIAQTKYYVPVVPLPPALQSYWLVVHILVAILGTAFFALGFALAAAQLLQGYRERRVELSLPPVMPFLKTLPNALTLENLTYRVNIIGFIFWTFTLIAGAIWAEKAWGRYWGWDTKEVWTFIVWVIYAGYIQARATRGWRGSRSAWLSVIGFSAVMFNFGIVNVFFHGLHSYSGLSS